MSYQRNTNQPKLVQFFSVLQKHRFTYQTDHLFALMDQRLSLLKKSTMTTVIAQMLPMNQVCSYVCQN